MKIPLSQAQQEYFENRSAAFRGALIMFGFKSIDLIDPANSVYIFEKDNIIIEMRVTPPEEVRTWLNRVNLNIFNSFEEALTSDRIQG